MTPSITVNCFKTDRGENGVYSHMAVHKENDDSPMKQKRFLGTRQSDYAVSHTGIGQTTSTTQNRNQQEIIIGMFQLKPSFIGDLPLPTFDWKANCPTSNEAISSWPSSRVLCHAPCLGAKLCGAVMRPRRRRGALEHGSSQWKHKNENNWVSICLNMSQYHIYLDDLSMKWIKLGKKEGKTGKKRRGRQE